MDDDDDSEMLSCKELFQLAVVELGFTRDEALHIAGATSVEEFDTFSEEKYETLMKIACPFTHAMNHSEPQFDILQAFMRSSHPAFNGGKSIADLVLEGDETSFKRAIETLEFRLGWPADFRKGHDIGGEVTVPNQTSRYDLRVIRERDDREVIRGFWHPGVTRARLCSVWETPRV
jgi:hypothetical protein